MKKQWFFFVLIIILLAVPALADFYLWEDQSGVAHITDYPPPSNLKAKGFERSGRPAMQPVPEKEKQPDIALYTKNNCPECDKARAFLEFRGLTFTEYNIDQDEETAAKRKEIDDGTDVPFAIINRSQIYGFSDAAYERALKTSITK